MKTRIKKVRTEKDYQDLLRLLFEAEREVKDYQKRKRALLEATRNRDIWETLNGY